MPKVEVLEVNGRKYRVADVVRLQDELRSLQAGVMPTNQAHIQGREGMTLEEAEQLARRRRQELERPGPRQWKPYTEYQGTWPSLGQSANIAVSTGHNCERCGRPAVGRIDSHHYCEHDLQQFIAWAKSQHCRVYDYRLFKESDLDTPLGNRWEV